MRKIGLTILFALLAISIIQAASTPPPKDNIVVTAVLDRDSIGLDEQAVLQVVVEGSAQDLPQPRLPTLPQFEVYSQGRSTNMQIINGAVTRSETYRYILIPNKSGTFPITPISLVYKNKRYKAPDLELTILQRGTSASDQLKENAQTSSGNTKDYFMEAVVDKKNPFVNEQITFTLKFYIGVQYYGSPELTEPTTTGFWTEILGNKAPYFQKINDRNYKVIERKYALFPTQTGELEIGRAMIRVTIPSRNRPNDIFGSFFGRGEEVSVRSQIVKVNVRPLPQAGKPDNFTGTIGRFNMTATTPKTTVEANQPLTMTIKITGTGNIKSVAAPIIPDVENKFRIYESSSTENVSKLNNKIGGTKIFEEVFIPKQPGKYELPSISYNYFDPDKEKYRSISTDPIMLNVTKPEGYTGGNEVPYAATGLSIGSESSDIRYIKQSPGDVSKPGQIILEQPLYLIVNGLPLLAFVGLVLMRKRQEKISSDVGLMRSRQAARDANKRLKKAKMLASENKIEALFEELYLVVTAYIADKLNISPHGLTSDKIKDLLNEKNADETMIEELMTLLKKCDFARYAPSSVSDSDVSDAIDKAENVMVKIYEIKF